MHVASTPDSASVSGLRGYWNQIKPALPRLVTNFGISSLARWGIVDLMKHNIHEMRPDRSANNSMPSRHAVWAYGMATTVSNYLIPYSPFWGVGAHAVAAGIGFERMIDHKHYAGDVLAGAGIGIGTSILSDQITRLIFHTPQRYTFPKKVNTQLSLSFSSGASFPLEKDYGNIVLGTSLISQLQFAAKVDDPWDLNGSIFMQTAPLKQDYYYLGTLTHIGAGVGGAYHCPIADTPLEFTASAGVGLRYAFAPKHIDVRGSLRMAKSTCASTFTSPSVSPWVLKLAIRSHHSPSRPKASLTTPTPSRPSSARSSPSPISNLQLS